MNLHERTITVIKRAELLSSLGAGVLGAGIALLWGSFLASYAPLLLLVGLAAHAAGMFKKHQFEQHGDNTQILWIDALYWLCWIGLAGLLFYLLIRLV